MTNAVIKRLARELEKAREVGNYKTLHDLETATRAHMKVKDIGDATVVVMYMFPEFMDLWFPIAKEHLKPGTRIVSHDYRWTKGWYPTAEETVRSSSRDNHKVIMWVVPEKK